MFRALFALTATVALAQQVSVEGRVVNDITGEGLRKAQVHLDGTGGRDAKRFVTTSAPDGSYKFENIPPGTYSVSADRSGYVYPRAGRRRLDGVQVAPGASTRVPDIKLAPNAAVSGRITDEDGDPVQGATVNASRFQFVMGRRLLITSQTATTNDLGEFRIHDLPPGRYLIGASKTGGFRGPGGREPERQGPDRDRQFDTVYYPGGSNPAAASPLELGAGQDYRGANLVLPRVDVYKVRGHVDNIVAGSSRRGWPSAIVYLYSNSAARFAERRPAPIDVKTGTFEIRGVRPGSYTVVAQQQGGEHSRVGVVNVDVGSSDVDDVRLALLEGFDLRGTVIAEGAAQPDFKSVAIQLAPVANYSSVTPSARSKPDGSFEIKQVTPLRYRVAVTSLPPGYWLRSIAWAGQVVPDGVVDFSAGGASELGLKLAPGTGSISGLVRNSAGDGQPGLAVTIAPEAKYASWFELYKETVSQPDGSFKFDNLRPGNYRVYAWEKIETGAHQDPDFLKPHETNSSPVSLETDATVTVHPKPIPAGSTGVL